MFALMVASAAGGFLYSELLKQRHSEDIRAMRQELKELKRELMQDLSAVAATRTSVTAQPTESRDSMVASVAPGLQPAHLGPARSSAESIAYMPACLAQDVGAQCEESDAQRIALAARSRATPRCARSSSSCSPTPYKIPGRSTVCSSSRISAARCSRANRSNTCRVPRTRPSA